MKICMFVRSLPPHAVGGLEYHTQKLTEGLARCGQEISIITTAHPEGKEYEKVNGVDIYYCPKSKPGRYSFNWWKESVKTFETLHQQKNFDLVHSQSGGAYYFLRRGLNKKYNLPVVVTLHGTSFNEIRTKLKIPFDLRSKISLLKNIYTYLFWDRFYLRAADMVIATSDQQLELIKKFYPVKAENLSLVYNGIDTDLFRPEKTSDIKKGDEFIILAVARLKKEKGIQNIIRALPELLKKISRVKLLIIGEGEYQPELQRLAEKLSVADKVSFLGLVPYNQLPEYYNLADIFVNPTIRENGYDLTIISAMACGSLYQGRKAGTLGDFGAFSFYPTKNLGADGDAGAIFVRQKKYYEKLKMLRNYGQSSRYYAKIPGGVNSRLDEIQAAILSLKLRYLDRWNKIKYKLALTYQEKIRQLNLPLQYQKISPEVIPAYHLFVVRLLDRKRDELRNYLKQQGIETLIHYPVAANKQPAFASYHSKKLPVTEQLVKDIVSLPFHQYITEKDIEYLFRTLKNFFTGRF